MNRVLLIFLAVSGLVWTVAGAARAAEMSGAEARKILAENPAGTNALSKKDLSGLDLSGVAFKGADLFGVNLEGPVRPYSRIRSGYITSMPGITLTTK